MEVDMHNINLTLLDEFLDKKDFIQAEITPRFAIDSLDIVLPQERINVRIFPTEGDNLASSLG